MSLLANRHSRRVLIGAVTAIALVVAIAVVLFPREELYVQFHSPDGRFTVIVYRRPQLFGMAPGQSGDAPGRALLVDQDGHVLHEAPVEMVELVEVMEWRPGAVEVRPFGEWSLPE